MAKSLAQARTASPASIPRMHRFEFVVPGPPVSAQARNSARLAEWKRIVRRAAETKWNRRGRPKPVMSNVRIQVTYYHDSDEVRIDEDNLLKPIQDSLNGLVYADDRFVTDASAHKRRRYGKYFVADLGPVQLQGFRTKREFLHVVVENAPDPSRPVK